MTLPNKVLEAGRAVLAADPDSFAPALAGFLSAFVGRPYMVRTGVVEGAEGQQSVPFACVVFTAGDGAAALHASAPVSTQRAAVVINGCDELTREELEKAYAHIASAKRLRQEAPQPGAAGRRSELLGVILARRSPLNLEDIAEEMQRLNAQMPATLWPDMVAVADTGVVQYGTQFAGENNVTGDFFLPGASLSYAPPMFIIMVMKPSGAYTLNRMLSFVVGHLGAFVPGSDVPKFPDIVKGMANTGVALTGYQYNLAGEVVPVPRKFYNDRYLAPSPFIIEDDRRRVLAALQFLPWQDGGVILLRGEMPLEMLLVFLGPVARQSSVIRRPGLQISSAMAITEADFQAMLSRFHRQSNMVVRPDETSWVVKKFADEGSSSPFIARLLLSLLKLRDAALPEPGERERFDKAYQAVTMPLLDARARMKKISAVWEGHAGRVHSGEIARVRGHIIHVDENVDHELGQEMDAFLNAATRTLKTGMQALALELGVNIGFLFQKQAAFEAALKSLASHDPSLASYLEQVRKWSDPLVNRRNAIEHEGWRLADATYVRAGTGVAANPPLVDGQAAGPYAAFMFDRLSCFVEEVTAHLLQRRLTDGITVTELPRDRRATEAPERFRVTLAIGGPTPWTISYKSASFENT